MWTPEGWYGRAQSARTGSDPYEIPANVARVWCIRPFGSSNECELPDATKLRTGAEVMLIFNDSTLTALTVNDFDGNLVAGLTHAGFAWLSLLDNSTPAGTWVARTGAPPIGSFSGYAFAEHILSFGGVPAAADKNDYRYYDIEADAWTKNDAPLDLNLCSAARAGDYIYLHRVTVMREYAFDTFSLKTSSTNSSDPSGSAGINGKVVAYHRGLNTVQEFDPGTNSWAALGNFLDLDDLITNQAIVQDDAATPDEAYIVANHSAATNIGKMYRHDRSGDSYVGIIPPTTNNYYWPFLFPGDDSRVHMAGGTMAHDSTTARTIHQSYDSAADTGWTTRLELPVAVYEGGSCKNPVTPSQANLGMGNRAETDNGSHWSWDQDTGSYTTLGEPDASPDEQGNSWATVSQ